MRGCCKSSLGIVLILLCFLSSPVQASPTYTHYLSERSLSIPSQGITLTQNEVRATSQGVVIKEVEGRVGVIVSGEEDFVEWVFFAEEEGLYYVQVVYYPIPGRRSSILREIQVNGTVPFLEAAYVELPRLFGDGALVQVDNQGNELRPVQSEIPRWHAVFLQDANGMYAEPFAFQVRAGWNSLRLVSKREPLAISALKLLPAKPLRTYEDYRVLHAYGEVMTKHEIKVQGQDSILRSSPSLFPVFDKGDPTLEPYHHTLIRLNSIGGNRWNRPGSFITWEVEVVESGFYKIAFKAKQNMQRGMYTNRRLYINNEVPFREVNSIRFPYSIHYNLEFIGDETEDYLFYLEKGKNEITLEVVLGDLAEIIRTAQESLYVINTAYRRIVMITSANPDPMRDYRLADRIPNLLHILREQSGIVTGLARELEAYAGERGQHVAVLLELGRQLASMADRPDTIPRRLGELRDNAGALGSWILTTREQPLSIDYLLVTGVDVSLPEAKPTRLQLWKHELNAFFSSFVFDYSRVGDVHQGENAAPPLTVWIGTGRDQAQALKEMIEDSFTPFSGIPVNLELVSMGILLPATLAGRGPDIAVGVPTAQPINFALRGAVYDLTEFPDYLDVVTERFYPSALLPFTFDNKVYALPNEQVFPMLFYRKDILEELGLKVPTTWEELYQLIPELQKQNMNLGLPFSTITRQASGSIGEVTDTAGSLTASAGLINFLTFLYQQGAELYKDQGRSTNLESEEAVAAFTRWTELYELYELPLAFDAANRFRMGEIPIMIQDYTFYNLLTVFAPELRGAWEFTLVPGTKTKEGMDHTVPVHGPGSIIMRQTNYPKEAWEFLKWWTSTETQVRYGRELESIMGPAARYPTANFNAMFQLPWTMEEARKLHAQWNFAKGVPEVPGSYMIGRHLDNAFRRVVYHNEVARDTLLDYDLIINEEIRIKRQEFSLD